MKRFFILTITLGAFLYTIPSYGQGCVAIRGNDACGSLGNSINLNKGQFNVFLGLRHFKSFRHFRGDLQEVNRLIE